MLDLFEAVEIRHPIRAASQFPDRLRAAEQKHRNERTLTPVEGQGLREHVTVANGRAPMGGQDAKRTRRSSLSTVRVDSTVSSS